jgi:hypothetical protein
LAFCGSHTLAKETHHLKTNSVMMAAVTSNKQYHNMDSVSDNYGGVKRRDTKNAGKEQGEYVPSISDCDAQQESHPDAIEPDNSSSFVAS